MKITKALRKACKLDKWARPKAWHGIGIAVKVCNNGRIARVPSRDGGFAWQPKLLDISDNWEVVSPEVVNQEHWRLYRKNK